MRGAEVARELGTGKVASLGKGDQGQLGVLVAAWARVIKGSLGKGDQGQLGVIKGSWGIDWIARELGRGTVA
eukprot:6342521-Alexandrium_andersonii.AAC.1